MGLRDAMGNRSARWAAVLAALAVAAVTFQVVRASRPRLQAAAQYYFLDLQTGQLVTAPASEMPIAIEGISDRGVSAKVYSCGGCDESQRKIAYVQSLTSEAQAVVVKGRPDDPAGALAYGRALNEGTVVAEAPTPGGQPRWVSPGSPAGIELIAGYRRQCGGSPRECLP